VRIVAIACSLVFLAALLAFGKRETVTHLAPYFGTLCVPIPSYGP
jgi:hypothetical protein